MTDTQQQTVHYSTEFVVSSELPDAWQQVRHHPGQLQLHSRMGSTGQWRVVDHVRTLAAARRWVRGLDRAPRPGRFRLAVVVDGADEQTQPTAAPALEVRRLDPYGTRVRVEAPRDGWAVVAHPSGYSLTIDDTLALATALADALPLPQREELLDHLEGPPDTCTRPLPGTPIV